jgi:AcrR family transcriptional regulator
MARSTPSAARPPRGKSKEQILQAALRLAVERGYDGTTMADVSAESGLPIGSVYWHFSNKEQLFVALLEHSYEKWMEIYAGPVKLREKVTRGIIGSVGGDPERYTLEESFLRVAQMMALDKRLGGLGEDSEVRKTYVRIRAKMFEVNVARVRESVPPELAEAYPELPTRLAVLALAMADGIYVHANSDVQLDFEMYADMASQALEGIIDSYAARAREEKAGKKPVPARS